MIQQYTQVKHRSMKTRNQTGEMNSMSAAAPLGRRGSARTTSCASTDAEAAVATESEEVEADATDDAAVEDTERNGREMWQQETREIKT